METQELVEALEAAYAHRGHDPSGWPEMANLITRLKAEPVVLAEGWALAETINYGHGRDSAGNRQIHVYLERAPRGSRRVCIVPAEQEGE